MPVGEETVIQVSKCPTCGTLSTNPRGEACPLCTMGLRFRHDRCRLVPAGVLFGALDVGAIAADEGDALLRECADALDLLEGKGSQVTRGRAFDLGSTRAKLWLGEGAGREFEGGWPAFCWGTWMFLWERKNEYFRIWGPIRFKYRRLRGLWEKAFGKCPFPWKDGPEGLR